MVRCEQVVDPLALVDRIEIALSAGVMSGCVGPNGAGKTTRIGMLLALMRPSSGPADVLGLGGTAMCQLLLVHAGD